MDTKTRLAFFALFAALSVIESEKTIMVQKFGCIFNDNSTIRDVKCFSKSVNRTVRLINAEGVIVSPISTILINGRLYKKTVVSYKPFLVNVTESICDFLGKNRGGIYVRLVAKLVLPYSNFNHPCPFSGHIYVRNMPLEMNSFLALWPEGEYRLDLLISTDEKLILVVQAFFETK